MGDTLTRRQVLDALKRKRVEDIFRAIRSRQPFAPRGSLRLGGRDPEAIVQVLAERIVDLEERIRQLEAE